jgi:2'-5' RNA ligase
MVDRLSDVYARVWALFLQAESTADGRHDTPHWRAHAGPYAACVIRVPPEALTPQFEALRQTLATLPGVRLHPLHFLHIMVQELGFVVDVPLRSDEISSARLEEFAQAATEPVTSSAPFAIEMGGANSFQDAVFLDIRGGSHLARLHDRLFDLAAIPQVPDYPYLPHCTIGHYDGAVSPHDIVEILLPRREEIFAGFPVTEVEIVTIDPAETYPALESYAVIPLEG